MKHLVLVFLIFGCLSTQLFSQSTTYCLSGRFAEFDFYSPLAIVSQYDISYGSNLDYLGANTDLKLDIHYPNPSIDPLPQRPLVVLVHGGSFYTGSKSDFTAYAQQLARKGYVAASVEYRLGWNYLGNGSACSGDMNGFRYAMYRALQDVNAAIRFLSYHASNYGIDPNNVFLLGQSAGAFTVLNAAFLDQTEANLLYPSAYVDLGSIDSASNAWQATYQLKGVFNWCGGVLDTTILDANEQIPVLSMHGLLDNVVPVDTGTFLYCYNAANPYVFVYGPQAMHKRLMQQGICSETNYDAAGMHCVYPSLDPLVYVPAKYTCFFKNILCGNCTTVNATGYNQSSCMDSAPLQNAQYEFDTNRMQVYPNPAFDYLLVQTSGKELNESSIRILDITGRAIAVSKGIHRKAHELTIDVKALRPGYYFISLQDISGRTQSRLFIKQ